MEPILIESRLEVVQITNGNFTDAGNFTAYDATSKRYHISKKKADAFGLKPDEKFKPFFITKTSNTYDERDKEGNPVLNADGSKKTFTRVEAGGLFWERAEADEAVVSSELSAKNQDFLVAKQAETQANELAMLKLGNKAKLKAKMGELELTTEDLQLLMQL